VRAPLAADELGVTEPTIYNAIRNLTDAGILREITGRTWGRIHMYGDTS
jgi:DNA-binding Lrp family transcriptional regulator